MTFYIESSLATSETRNSLHDLRNVFIQARIMLPVSVSPIFLISLRLAASEVRNINSESLDNFLLYFLMIHGPSTAQLGSA